jgi:uncharacterized protein YjbI with pentapeptide repeats
MGSKHDDEGSGRSALTPSSSAILFHRADIVGETVVDEMFNGVRADRAVIADTLFRNCIFDRCSFRTSDLEAVVFEGCRFTDCDFTTADFRSAEFARCQIEACNFTGGAIKASRFEACVLKGGRFGRQALDENVWVDCELTGVSFRRATLLHMAFTGCRFTETGFADCTSLYHFFDDCHFSACRMNADCVALSAGLTRENLEAIALVWQGLRQRSPGTVDARLSGLLQALVARRWGVATASLAINFQLLETRDALRVAFASIEEALVANRPLRRDEVRYLSRLIARLAERDALPFLAVAEGLDLYARAEALQAQGEENLRALALALKEAELAALETWDRTRSMFVGRRETVVAVEFTFERRPDADLLPMLSELSQQTSGKSQRPLLIEARSGSYIEVVTMTLGTLMAFVIALGMLVRIIDGLITARARVEVLVSKQLPASVRTRALQPLPSASAELIREVGACMALLSDGHLPVVASGASSIVKQLRAINVSPRSGGRAAVAEEGVSARRGSRRRSGAG